MVRAIALLGVLISPPVIAQTHTVPVLGVVAAYTDKTWSATAPAKLQRLLQQTDAFYSEGSGGRHRLAITTHPAVLTIDQPRPLRRCAAPDPELLGQAMTRAGIDLVRYEKIVLVVPASAQGCNGGVATWFSHSRNGKGMRLPVAISWSLTDRFVMHEYGHTDGLGHATSISCGSVVIGKRCTIKTYGNVWDAMGNGSTQTFNVVFRSHLAWIDPIVHTTGTATYQVGPAYAPGPLPSGIEVRLPSPRPNTITVEQPMSLWIEWRKPMGFDSGAARTNFQAGAMINVTGQWSGVIDAVTYHQSCVGTNPCLLDMTPGDSNHRNGGLEVGKEWIDENTGVLVRVSARSETSLTVTVSIPPGA